MNKKSLSIIIPAYNEEGNIRPTCEGMAALAQKYLEDYEILVFDDCSPDRTSEVVKDLQCVNPHIVLIRNEVNKGLGYNYRAGILKARCAYTIMVPGDNEVIADSLTEVFQSLGSTDIIVCSSTNAHVRPFMRQLISRIFTFLVNAMFGLKVNYYNGPAIIRTDLAKENLPSTNSFAYMAVLLVYVLKLGATYTYSTFSLRPRKYGKTKAFEFKNVVTVISDILRLFWDVNILGVCRGRRLKAPVGENALDGREVSH